MTFTDRYQAGRFLAASLTRYAGADVVVLGLPRGGVVVASEVAKALGAPLDVIVVRKLGVPFQPELAMGAIAEGGERVINDMTVRMAAVDPEGLAGVEDREAESWPGRRAASAPIGARCRSAIAASSSSTTASPPAQPPGWRARWPGPKGRPR